MRVPVRPGFLCLTLTVLLSACSGGLPRPAAPASSAAPDPFAAPGASGSSGSVAPALPKLGQTALAVGECFDAQAFRPGVPLDMSGARPVPCAGPHQHEVYDVGTFPAPDRAPYPGDGTIDAYIQDRCLGAFAAYVGIDFQRSTLDFATVRPDRASWDKGDRVVACMLHDSNFALLTGSMRNTSR